MGAVLTALMLAGCGEPPREAPQPAPVAILPEPVTSAPQITTILMTREELFKMARGLLTRLERFNQVDEIVNFRTGVVWKAADSQPEDDARILWINDHVIIIVSSCGEVL